MSKYEKWLGNFMVTLIISVIVFSFIMATIGDIKKRNWLGLLGGYGSYKAYVEYEEMDANF